MLRINLLPAYIAERKKTRNAIIGASALVLLVLGIGLYYNFGMLKPDIDKRVAEAEEQERQQKEVEAIGQQATTTAALIIPYQEKVEFVKAVQFANIVRQKIYRNAARYTYRTVEYDKMDVTGNTLSISGAVRSVADLGRMYITMFGNPDVTAVSIQGIPSYPNNQPVYDPNTGGPSPTQGNWFPVQLTATLVQPVVTPQLPASLGATGTTGGGFGATGFGGGGGVSRPSGFSGAPSGSSYPSTSGGPSGAASPGAPGAE